MARSEQQPVIPPPSRVVASFATCASAQRALDVLAGRRFLVDQVAIVAGEPRFVEDVTGRRKYGSAAMNGDASGAITGALLGSASESSR